MLFRGKGKQGAVSRTIGWVVAPLVVIGVAASLARGFGVVSAVLPDGPPPELSLLDRGAVRFFMAPILGVKPGSDAYRSVDEQTRRMLRKFNQNPTLTLIHVVPAGLFMVLVPLQFSSRMRGRRIRWHRWSGRLITFISVPLCVSGLWFGLRMPFGGAVESSAIVLFGALFLYALARGFIAVQKGDIVRHRKWMIRAWAVALGVSMQRMAGVVLLVLTRTGPDTWFGPSIWIGFATTVALGEYWIRRTRAVSPAEVGAGAGVSLASASPVDG